MWVGRWRFDVTRERFGSEPKTEPEPATSLLVALAPLADGLIDPLERAKARLSVPDERLMGAAFERFGSGRVSAADLVAAIADPSIWPARGDWLVVTCRDDGTARYGIAPFIDVAEVTNAREACAAIRGVIGD